MQMTTESVPEVLERKRVHPVVTKTYVPRVVVFTLTALLMPAVLPHSQMLLIVTLVLINLAYPHITLYLGRRAADTRAMGFRSLYLDGFVVGMTTGLISCRVLPTFVFVLLAVSTLVVMGGWQLFLRAIWVAPLGALVGATVSGFDPFAPLSPLATALCYAIVAGFVIAMAYSVNVTTREVIATKYELRDKNQQILKQTDMLASMNEFTHKVNSSPHLDEVVAAVLEGLQKIFDFDLMGIGIIDRDSNRLVVDREVGAAAIDPDKFESLSVPLDEMTSVFAFCIANREPVYLPQIEAANIEKMSPSDRAIYDTAPARALLVLPLVVQDQVIGTISFGHSNQHFDLSKGVIQTIEQYVSRLAAAIRNANLYEEAHAARADAQKANETKSQFLANMSHELRTPMNAVIGYSEMLEEEAEDEGLTDFIPDLKKIQSAGRHLLELINGILDLSKIEANKMELYLETGDVARLVDGAVSTVKPLAEKNGNTLTIEKDENLGQMHVDRTKVRQALLNLLSNAAKFTDEGTIRLAVHRSTLQGQDWLEFAVSDSGIGMNEAQLAKLFQPFTQADASTTRKYGGTGLGLTISKHFCEMMGGTIEVQSAPGRGSTFTIRLPAVATDSTVQSAAADEANNPDKQQARNVAGKPTVLVIDDDATIRDIMRKVLTREGFHVVTASGGEEGLRLARQIRPVAITLDVLMPDMDGWMVLSKLKSDPELADIPVVMQTIVDDKKTGYALGASEYVTKPVDRARIASILSRFSGPSDSNAIMIVEDDIEVMRLLREQLRKEGFEVIEARTGRDALGLLHKQTPRMILLDLLMPEIDGFDVLEKIRANPEWQSIPVVILTGKDLSDDDSRRLRFWKYSCCFYNRISATPIILHF